MQEQSRINKQAWEYRAYEFWEKRDGTPAEYAAIIKQDPVASLKTQASSRRRRREDDREHLWFERTQGGAVSVTRGGRHRV